jgi:UDP-N-acetylmuramate dehydrogenase
MSTTEETLARLAEIPTVTVSQHEPLARHTRFGIGGPARLFVEAESSDAFIAALRVVRAIGLPEMVIGGGTNLIVSDDGFPGAVLRYNVNGLSAEGARVHADAGAVLNDLVDHSIAHGLQGLETLAGIPGWVGGALYGNAGAYGRSISESVQSVRFFDGCEVRDFDRAACEFHYRESLFKRRKRWVILSAELSLTPGDAAALRRTADDIVAVRNRKFPVTMQCAGSIFKNFLLAELPDAVAAQVPPDVIREGKIPAAWFLEQVGAKGLRTGGIQVADYHANLIYNTGSGTARELRELIADLKARVRSRFAIEVEEEVQYVGFWS